MRNGQWLPPDKYMHWAYVAFAFGVGHSIAVAIVGYLSVLVLTAFKLLGLPPF